MQTAHPTSYHAQRRIEGPSPLLCCIDSSFGDLKGGEVHAAAHLTVT